MVIIWISSNTRQTLKKCWLFSFIMFELSYLCHSLLSLLPDGKEWRLWCNGYRRWKWTRWSNPSGDIFIIKGFRTIVFIFIVISTTFRPIWPPAFFRYLSNSGTYTELRTTSFIESTGVACADSVSRNRVQVFSIPVLLLACSQDWTCNLQMIVSLEAKVTNAYKRYAMCPAGQFRVNFSANSPKTLYDKNHQASSQKFRQLLAEVFCISHCVDTFGNGMNPTSLPSTMGNN